MLLFNTTDFVAGWFGGVCGLLVGHPFDTIKVRQQTYGTNIPMTIGNTLKYEGFLGFYKGLLFPLLTIGPSNAIYFGIYGNLMKNIENKVEMHEVSPYNKESMYNIYIAGCVAGVFQTLFYCPVELIKTVMQASTSKNGTWKWHNQVIYKNSYDVFKHVIKEQGIAGLYRGNVAMLWRDGPTGGIYSLTYEMLMHWSLSTFSLPTMAKEMIAGGAAGFLSFILVLPFDVIKTKIQADNPG